MRAFVFIAIAVAVALWALRGTRSRETVASASVAQTALASAPVLSVSRMRPPQPIPPKSIASVSTPDLERASLATLSSIVGDEARVSFAPAELIKRLASAGYQPIASRDHDDVMGSMITIETRNALPGSRYFRAQYFSDADGNYEAQHMSVEFKPGTPIHEIVHALEMQIGSLGRQALDTPDEKLWKTEDGRSLYIKRLDDSDIQESAIHAYSPDDRGTIFVSLERPVAGHEDFDD